MFSSLGLRQAHGLLRWVSAAVIYVIGSPIQSNRDATYDRQYLLICFLVVQVAYAHDSILVQKDEVELCHSQGQRGVDTVLPSS